MKTRMLRNEARYVWDMHDVFTLGELGHRRRMDMHPEGGKQASQLYMNSGTWHTYYDLAVHQPREQKFVPYQVLSYLTFYQGDERGGRRFETWSGSFSN